MILWGNKTTVFQYPRHRQAFNPYRAGTAPLQGRNFPFPREFKKGFGNHENGILKKKTLCEQIGRYSGDFRLSWIFG